MYLVGLTGGIASGKSLVAHRFVERHGFELIDADEIAREVVLPGTPTWKKIVNHFGETVLDEQGFVDRPVLGRIVFNDADKRALLNELTHPPVVEQIAEQLELLAAYDGVVVLDVPLLVESGVAAQPPTRSRPDGRDDERPTRRRPDGRNPVYHAIVVVAARPETQVRRLVTLRGFAEEDARSRVAAQAPLEDKLAVATHVIWNEGAVAETEERTDEVAAELAAAARAKAAEEAAHVPND